MAGQRLPDGAGNLGLALGAKAPYRLELRGTPLGKVRKKDIVDGILSGVARGGEPGSSSPT